LGALKSEILEVEVELTNYLLSWLLYAPVLLGILETCSFDHWRRQPNYRVHGPSLMS